VGADQTVEMKKTWRSQTATTTDFFTPSLFKGGITLFSVRARLRSRFLSATLCLCGLSCFWLCLVPVLCQNRLPTPRIYDQINARQKGLAVWWVGNAGWLVKSDNILIGTDLDLELEEKIYEPPISADDLAKILDVVFVSHHHGDHCNAPTLKVLSQKSNCTFVLPQTCVDEEPGLSIPKGRLIVPQPLLPFDIRGIHVEPIHAIHGNQDFTVLTREKDFIKGITHNCGYVLTIQGKRFLHPGDSVLTEEHLSLSHIDVLFISPTVHNMFIDRSMILINQLEPEYIFPQHFDTYRQTPDNMFWTKGYPDELKLKLSKSLQKRYHKLSQGEMFVIK
jgi:L-ascorbate metabolism protein UlaG (beta-lactamase superfamily)